MGTGRMEIPRGARRVWIATGAIWAIGTALGSTTIIAAWVLEIGGVVRLVSNLFWIIALPGWLVAYRIGGVAVRDDPVAIVLVNAGVWAIIVAALAALRWAAKHLSRRIEIAPGAPIDGSRRAFMTRSLGGASLALVGAGTPAYATLIEPNMLRVRRLSVPINDLPDSLVGLRIAHVSDTHLGPRVPESMVAAAYERVAALSPDIVAHTGDHYHDGSTEIDRAGAACAVFTRAATIGSLGVLGNHDYWGDPNRMLGALGRAGVRMIDNDRVWIDARTRSIRSTHPAGPSLRILGLGDLTDGVVDPHRAYRDGADDPTLVLAHNPDTAELAFYRDPLGPRCDLMLAGHTHGGQVRIPVLGTPIVPSDYGQRYAGGLCTGPRFPVHVSRGVGMSILPVRVGVPPEITLITLTRPA